MYSMQKYDWIMENWLNCRSHQARSILLLQLHYIYALHMYSANPNCN